MRRAIVLIAILAGLLGSGLAYAARISRVVVLPQIAQVPVGTQREVCVKAYVTYVNVDHLRWTLRSGRGSHLKLLSNMEARCREYYAPDTAGSDLIKIAYSYRGNQYYAEIDFDNPAPTRP